MNPLQKHARLYVNGKFQVKWPDNTISYLGSYVLQEFEEEHDSYFDGNPRLEPRLIARQISDMTDEELEKLSWDVDQLIYLASLNMIPLEDALTLTELGVYPGPQSHFEDETVELKK